MSHSTTSSNAGTPLPEMSFVAQGKTHLVLWGMAEEYLEQARSLCFVATAQSGSQPGWRARHQDLILCAIKCLVACVSIESLSMTQLDKAKSRLRLAQVLFEETESLNRAEEEVSKAIIIADSIQGSSALEIQLRLYELQTQIYIETKRFRLAKNTLRIASAEAAKQELHCWTYQFCFFKARVHFMMDDVAGSLTTLNQGAALADQQGDFDIKMTFWIVAGQYSLMLSKWSQAMFYLQKMAPHMGVAELLDFAKPAASPTGEEIPLSPAALPSPVVLDMPQELDQQQCQSQQLRVFFLILYIFCMIRSGRVEKTLFALNALHGTLDGTRPRDMDELQGVFRVFLKNRIDNSPQGRQQASTQQHNPAPLPYVCIRWMTFSQVYCLTYLLSGICNKADMTQPMKSQQFLVEGIKVVDREFSVNDYATSTIYVRRNQRWFSLLLMTMLLHLTDVYLLKFELENAQETLLKATYWAQVCGVWDLFKWRVSLTVGMMLHLGSRLEEAMDWYNICLGHTESHHQDSEGYEAKTLALINIGFIFSGERYYNHQRAKEIVMEAKARHSVLQSANVRCALHILDGATNEGLIPARQHLHESLKTSGNLMNTQLRSLSLMLLGSFYKDAHDAHAEKMLAAGFTHAAKTHNQIVAAAAGFTLKDLYLQTSRGIKASEQAQRNKVFLDEVDRTFQSRVLDPLLHNSDNNNISSSSNSNNSNATGSNSTT
ncbi:MAG: cohesin loading factor [Linnemannia gamsii]|nr:MAG: cohesin loading factor [Linnemannia gamsii]